MCRYGCVRLRTQYSTLPSLWLCIYFAILCRTCVCVAVTYDIVCSLTQYSFSLSCSYQRTQRRNGELASTRRESSANVTNNKLRQPTRLPFSFFKISTHNISIIVLNNFFDTYRLFRRILLTTGQCSFILISARGATIVAEMIPFELGRVSTRERKQNLQCFP